MNWSDSGIITVPGINAKNDIQNTDALKRAEEFGLSIQ